MVPENEGNGAINKNTMQLIANQIVVINPSRVRARAKGN